MRTQISTSVSEETLRQFEELRERMGASGSEVLARAIENLYREGAMNQETEIRDIVYAYDNDDASIFGSDSDLAAEHVDGPASVQEYEDRLLAALGKKFPRADIEIKRGQLDYIAIDFDRGHTEYDTVWDIAHEIWESWDWLVYETGWARCAHCDAMFSTATLGVSLDTDSGDLCPDCAAAGDAEEMPDLDA